MPRILKFSAGFPVALLLVASQAQAAILCDGNFQILGTTEISTPYCQDENLAAFERARGDEFPAMPFGRIRKPSDKHVWHQHRQT